MADASVTRSLGEPHVGLQCDCGWSGTDDDIQDWAIQTERDRVVRRCPDCERAVPEWGALSPIDGVARIARGSLKRSLVESEYTFEEN